MTLLRLGLLLGAITLGACSGSSGGTQYGDAQERADGGPAVGTASEAALANRVLELVNNHRRAASIPALAWCVQCAEVAYAHSQDMQERSYFDHDNPDGDGPFERMDRAGLTYSSAGENIAEGYTTAEDAVAGWMNSPGHRANILNTDFTELGVGVREGASPGPWWTQTFRRP